MQRSIRKQLFLWLAIPLGVLWFCSTLASFYLALKFSNDTFDRDLVNSADSVVARIRAKGDHLVVDLPPAAQAILKHDDVDTFYYSVLSKTGKNLSGDTFLPLPEKHIDDSPQLRTVKMQGKVVRLAEISASIPEADVQPVIVQVAQTMNSRQHLFAQIFMSMVLPQLLMVLLGAAALSTGVTRGLAPLQFLKEAIAKRSKHDLSPVSEDMAPAEAYPLVLAINDLLSRLREDIKAQQRFISSASHQLRTPLAGLKAYSSLGVAYENIEEMRGTMRQIDTGLDRTSHLVTQMLALARSDSNSTTATQMGRADLSFVVSDVIAERVSLAVAKEIDLGFESADGTAEIIGDQTSLQHLVANLLDNALLYTPRGGRVSLRVTKRDQLIELAVADSGPGISLKEREKIFERFYRIPGSAGGGSGLGLAIVKDVAANHNAEINIASPSYENGTGTTMTVTFPVYVQSGKVLASN
ncbi:sensor histidine kinase [soil metagenome]